MRRVSVFCGSANGFNAGYAEAAYLLGKILALNKIGVVYGGTRIGLMGKLADGALDHEGEVTGVLPWFLEKKEIAHPNLTDLIYVNTLHERKQVMSDLCDGIIALPGGLGTMDEFFEILTWAQLKLHDKPVALLNTLSYYDPLLLLLDQMVNHGFMKQDYREVLICDHDINNLVDKMQNFKLKTPEVGFRT
jgi:uncharacterized protein (TIGR00730 family)